MSFVGVLSDDGNSIEGWLLSERLKLERVGRALGAGPLGHDAGHARQVADLTVYLRQHHAERDLEQLGRLLAKEGSGW